ncbi:MAG: hypothetical protein V7L25_05055 [Nostoc sp.]
MSDCRGKYATYYLHHLLKSQSRGLLCCELLLAFSTLGYANGTLKERGRCQDPSGDARADAR